MAAKNSEKRDPAEIVGLGKCLLCEYEGPQAQVIRHLEKCAGKLDQQGRVGPVVRLRFEAAGDPRYWIYVDARADAALAQLDRLLRSVWLECCGHMSAFQVGPTEPSMRSKVKQVFHARGLKFSYEYDFGSTTALKGQVCGVREGSLGGDAVRLVARNNPLPWVCAECGAPATRICCACIEEDDECLFCEPHANHSHDDDYLLPVVNSPRMGVCGYTGTF
jgi:hypothetical protein